MFILRYVYEYKVDEIATLMTMKPGSVKSKLSRATAQLRAIHAETNADPQPAECSRVKD